MSSIVVDRWLHNRIAPQNNCRNGQLVSASYQSALAALANQVARLRPKEFASFHGTTQGIGRNADWNFAGHTSPMCGLIVARILVAKSASDSGTGTVTFGPPPTPFYDMYLETASGTYIGDSWVYAGQGYGEAIEDVPDEWSEHTLVLSAQDYRDTDIRGEIYAYGGGRLVGATVYEYPMPPDTIYDYINQQFSVGQPILDSHRYDVMNLAINQWKRGASHLGNYSGYSSGASVTSATYHNVWDDSLTTARTLNSPCWFVDLRYCNTKRTTTVPCRFEAYAYFSGAGAGNVRIVDESGTALSTIAVAGSTGWYQATVNLPATSARYFLEHNSDGVNAMSTLVASLYQYSA